MEQEIISGNRVFIRRIGAYVIDGLIIMPIAFLLFSRSLFSSEPDRSAFFSDILFFTLVAIVALLCKDIFFGRSIGKLLFGLCVRDAVDPAKIPAPHRLIFRNLFLFIWPVELIVSSNNSERKRLGDKLAGTQVIASGKMRGIQIAVIVVLAVILSCSAFFFLVTQITQIIKNDGSYKTATEYIKSDKDILSETGTISGFNLSSGSVSYSNGYGSADLELYVDGNLKDITVHIELKKDPGSDWTIEYFSY